DERNLFRGNVLDIGAFQASLVVESSSATLDATPVAATLTLPDAVSLANTYAGAAISFDPAVFNTATMITLTASQLELSNTPLSSWITGPTAALTISGGGLSRVFQVDPNVTATLSGLAITGGAAAQGAGLDNLGTVSLVSSHVIFNTATSAGGGLYNQSGA